MEEATQRAVIYGKPADTAHIHFYGVLLLPVDADVLLLLTQQELWCLSKQIRMHSVNTQIIYVENVYCWKSSLEARKFHF